MSTNEEPSTLQNKTKHDKIPDEVDQKLSILLIENPSATDLELSSILKLSRQTINKRRNSEAVQSLVSNKIMIPTEEYRRLVFKGLKKLELLIDDPDPRIALVAASHLLKLAIPQIPQPLERKPQIVWNIGWGDEQVELENNQ